MTSPVNLPTAVKGYCDLWWHATNHTHYVSPLFCLMTTSARIVRTLCFAVQSLGSLDLPEVPSLSRASTSRATGQNRAPLEFRGFPLLIASVFFTVLFQPKTTFSAEQLSLSRPLFSSVRMKAAQTWEVLIQLAAELLTVLFVPMLSSCFKNPRVLPITRNNKG